MSTPAAGPSPTTTPHLTAALLALAAAAAATGAFAVYARRVEAAHVHALAAVEFPEKSQGSALQRAALRTSDLLPAYGSSELLEQVPYEVPFEAVSLFHDYPTGFDVFPIAKPKDTCLVIAEKLAAVAPLLRGRKVVVSISPTWFFARRAGQRGYAGNFSPLHGYELAFNSRLGLAWKRDAARRMLYYERTLVKHPVLFYGLQQLAEGTRVGDALYWGVFPLGRIETETLRLQDHWEVVRFLRSQPTLADAPRREHAIDWDALAADARREYARRTAGSPYGVDPAAWRKEVKARDTHDPRAAAKIRLALQRSVEWTDLELLLRELRDLGARPLLVSPPIHGVFFDAQGLTRADRDLFYDRMAALARQYGFPAEIFAEYDMDPSFSIDPLGHLSPVGWIHYDRVLDSFYHDESARLPDSRP